MAAWAALVLVIWRHYWPMGFARRVSTPARSKWRAWGYRRKWAAVTTIADLAPWYLGRIILPVLVKVTSTRYVDRVHVRLVSGQCASDFIHSVTVDVSGKLIDDPEAELRVHMARQ
jgi:hypothetical protein